MTFSIAAWCPRTGQLGVGALTARPAVGKLVAHVQAGGGAVATQATPNPFLAYDGLPLLSEGRSPQDVLTELLAHDPGREVRQVGMVDRHGGSYAFTGSRTKDWAGHCTGPGYAAQGNRLVSPHTLAEIVRVFEENEELDLAERLVLAIGAGEEAGGDRHGARSATVTVTGDQPYPLWDVRIDDSEHPARELHRLHSVFREDVLPPSRGCPPATTPWAKPPGRHSGHRWGTTRRQTSCILHQRCRSDTSRGPSGGGLGHRSTTGQCTSTPAGAPSRLDEAGTLVWLGWLP